MNTETKERNSIPKKSIFNQLKRIFLDWNKTQLALSILIVCFLYVSPLFIKSPWLLNMLIVSAIFAYFGLAWNIVGGFAGQLLIGFVSFVGVGAYTTMILYNSLNVSPWVGFFASALSSSLLALFIAFVTLRYGLKLDYFALFTLALMIMLGIIYSKLKFAGGPQGMGFNTLNYSFKNVIFATKPPYLIIATTLLLLGIIIQYLVFRSKTGRYLVAIRENEDAAASLGVDVSRYKTIAVIIAGVMAGFGGGYYVMYTTFIYPFEIFTAQFNVSLLVAPIIGGRGSIVGPIIGGFLNKIANEVVRANFASQIAGITLIIYGGLITIFALFLPKGISGFLQGIHSKIVSKITRS